MLGLPALFAFYSITEYLVSRAYFSLFNIIVSYISTNTADAVRETSPESRGQRRDEGYGMSSVEVG